MRPCPLRPVLWKIRSQEVRQAGKGPEAGTCWMQSKWPGGHSGTSDRAAWEEPVGHSEGSVFPKKDGRMGLEQGSRAMAVTIQRRR